MNTKKILLLTSDPELKEIVKISALTLTKLNCQVSIIEADEKTVAVEESVSEDLNFILLDLDMNDFEPLSFIRDVRADSRSVNKKIISVYSGSVNAKEIHSAGCDSIMSKEEFKKVVVNILKY